VAGWLATMHASLSEFYFQHDATLPSSGESSAEAQPRWGGVPCIFTLG
jgi:hypothetical protein